MNEFDKRLSVAILAGGLATRLHPVTEKIPKALVEVAGRPFLFHQIELLRSQGLTKIVLCVGHLGEMIRDQFGDGSESGVSLDYSFDGDELLGTGGALRKALPLLGESFFVLYGDSFLPIDFLPVAEAFYLQGRGGVMTVFRNEERWDTSNVWFENNSIRAYDKKHRQPQMRHIDFGLSVLSASVIRGLPVGAVVDLADVMQQMVAKGQLSGYEVHRRFFEIGSHEGLAELDKLLSSDLLPIPIPIPMSTYSEQHLLETKEIAANIPPDILEKMVDCLAEIRARGGRLFILGVGGSAANASHAVNDFRKIGGFECYSPTDNVSELTARTNDEGWATVFSEWLRGSRLKAIDGVLIFSVGGGSLEKNISPNLVEALKVAKDVGATILGIVGRDGGYTAQVADVCAIVPTVNPETTTPHAEAFQAVIWHLLVSHPKLKFSQTKWESTK